MTDGAAGWRPQAMSWWRRWGGIIKLIFVTAGVTWLCLTLLARSELSLMRETGGRLIGAFILAHLAFALMALRWLLAMKAIGVSFTYGASWAVTAQSYFFYHVTPLAIGADIARFSKALSLARSHPRGTVIAAVFVDRALGFFALACVFFASLPFVYDEKIIKSVTAEHWRLGAIGVLVACIIIASAALLAKRSGLFKKITPYTKIFWKGRSWFAASTGAALAMQVIYGVALWAGAVPLGIEITLLQSIYAAAGALFFSLIPASMFGIGAAQVVGGIIYLSLGLPEHEVVFMVALGYILHLSMGFLGAVAELLNLDRRWSPHLD